MSNTEKQDPLLAILDQYEHATTSKPKSEKVFSLTNYFTTHLKPEQKDAKKVIRILSTNDGSSPFVEFYGHKVQVEGEWKTFACLKHEKKTDCPFCEAHDALRATGKEAQKDLAKKYSPKKMYIVKVIDRDNEDHGVKFWRFNHDYRKQGILDKIYGVLQAVGKDITNAETGRDLMILLARDQNNRPTVQSISQKDASPLSTDKVQAEGWLSDARTWEDVYSVKPYEYLEIIVKGGSPAWDKTANKYVDKATIKENESNDTQNDLTIGENNVKPNVKTASAALPTVSTATQTAVTSTGADQDDDLPF